MSTDTPRTTERLHLLENEHDDVAFESLSDFARQLERELAEAKADLERLTEGFPITDAAQVVQLQQQLSVERAARDEETYKSNAAIQALEEGLAKERAAHEETKQHLQLSGEHLRRTERELRSLREEVSSEFSKHGYAAGPTALDRIIEERDSLRSALAQAEADTKRMDNQDLYRIEKYHGAWHVETRDGFEGAAKTLREAIDAALAEQKGEAQ